MRGSLIRYIPLIVGALLLYSGIFKLIFPGEAVMGLDALDFNHRFALGTVACITALEIYLGAILLLRLDLRRGLAATTVLILAFTVYLAYLVTLAHPPSCGCMGLTAAFNSNRANALLGLARNCVLLWLLQAAREYYFPPTDSAKKTEGSAVATPGA